MFSYKVCSQLFEHSLTFFKSFLSVESSWCHRFDRFVLKVQTIGTKNFFECLEPVILVLQTITIIIFGISSFNGGK